MTHTKIRWPYIDPPLQEGDVLVECTLFQLEPGTPICAGIKDLTFINCNCVNVQPQADWTIQGGNWSQTEYCTHDRPELIARGLKACAEDCSHRSAEKEWVEISEAEYRKLRPSYLDRIASVLGFNPDAPAVEVRKTVDDAAVTQQKFEEEVYIFAPKLVKTASVLLREVRADADAEANR